MAQITILLADNNTEFLDTLCWFLEREGYCVLTATNREVARSILEQNVADLAVLDIRLANDRDEKDLSGIDLARTARTTTPKIIYSEFPTYETARLALGPRIDELPPAIDFVSKDEGPEALLTAVRNGLLLKEKWVEHSTQEVDAIPPPPPGLWVDMHNRSVLIDGEVISLTPQEFHILRFFYQNSNQVVTRQQIVCEALGEDEFDGVIEENRVNNIVRRIRQKIEVDTSSPRFLQTVRGHGFKLVLPTLEA